ncbi:MAG: CapA family protein [Oscillospiraceae bacterium]|nr:CapA family protein [Oscillospiraceae bacterium]
MKALLLGDLCPNDANKQYFIDGDVNALFKDTLDIFKGNDINMLNLECAITESTNAIKKFGPNLAAPLNTANVMKAVGINYCGLSNNHIFDFGIEGAESTLKALTEAGIAYTGFGDNYDDSRKNLVIEKDGEKICVIAVCEHEYSYALEDRMGSRPYDEYDTQEDIRKAKAENDRVIVLYHGGKEHCQYPSPRLVRLCRAMARNGADLVLCQHTHCIGIYEQYEGCHILYGQGNFHFNPPPFVESPLWNQLLAVKYDTKSHEIEFIPIVNDAPGITLAKGEEKENILSAFAKRNEELQNGEWKKGWHQFCLDNAESYLGYLGRACAPGATQRDNDVFGHYLDCEAHTDVWRELFPTYNLTNERRSASLA